MFDKSHLSIGNAHDTGVIHKDYIAHCHRWNYVIKYLERRDPKYNGDMRFKHTSILDIGCGKDLMLYKPNTCLLYTSPSPRDRQKSRMPSSA